MTDPIDRPYLPESEPDAQQQGVDVPGFWLATTDRMGIGIYNGNFRLSPPQAASNIDVATSTVGSNFVPGFRFVQSSNTVITGSIVNTSTLWSGTTIQGASSNFRFSHDASGTSGAAFVEQIVDIGGSPLNPVGANLRSEWFARSGTWTIRHARQYLAADGSLAGMPPEAISSTTGGPAAVGPGSYDTLESVDPPPAFARYLRWRYIAESSSANGVLELYSMRRESGFDTLPIGNGSELGALRYSGSNLSFSTSTTGRTSILNRQAPAALTYVLLNVPDNASTELQISDNALGITASRVTMPFGGSVVAVSYRLSTAITEGGASAMQIEVRLGNTTLWTSHTLTTTSDVEGYAVPTGPDGLDSYRFTQGQTIGARVTTSATFAPTTLDMAVTLWVALEIA